MRMLDGWVGYAMGKFARAKLLGLSSEIAVCGGGSHRFAFAWDNGSGRLWGPGEDYMFVCPELYAGDRPRLGDMLYGASPYVSGSFGGLISFMEEFFGKLVSSAESGGGYANWSSSGPAHGLYAMLSDTGCLVLISGGEVRFIANMNYGGETLWGADVSVAGCGDSVELSFSKKGKHLFSLTVDPATFEIENLDVG